MVITSTVISTPGTEPDVLSALGYSNTNSANIDEEGLKDDLSLLGDQAFCPDGNYSNDPSMLQRRRREYFSIRYNIAYLHTVIY